MSVYFDRVQSFGGPPVTEPRKVQRVKLLEEAAEAVAAAKRVQLLDDAGIDRQADTALTNMLGYDIAVAWRTELADELADVIQAAVNLAAIHGITAQELDAALTRCRERNRERGRI